MVLKKFQLLKDRPMIEKTREQKIITVKNAGSEPDTTAYIVRQNHISYLPKVSVIIPVYNVKAYLRQCLDSVIKQTLQEIEIICVDDGSTDGSLDILKEYADKDARITVLSQENLHAGIARNAGLAVAQGEYVHFLDSDDWVELDAYEKLYQLAKKQNVNCIKFCSYSYDNQTQKVNITYFNDMKAIPDKYFERKVFWFEDYQILKNANDAPWSGLYNRQVLKDNNCFFDSLLCANDVSFFYRCLNAIGCVFLTKKRFVYYRINNNKSLIEIRAQNFNCQITVFHTVSNLINNNEIRLSVQKHLIQSIFFRYRKYINDYTLSQEIKDKIRTEMQKFCSTISSDLVSDEDKTCYIDLAAKEKLVSVIIPVYNAEKYLNRCLNSVVRQTLKNIEIICIDDCSTDNSLQILNEYAQQDSRIIVICNNKNLGAPGAVKNIGIKQASGEYIGFVDADDYVDLNYFEELYKSAKQNNADIAASMKVTCFGKIITTRKIDCVEGVLNTVKERIPVLQFQGSNCSKIYKREMILKNNINCCEIRNIAEDNYFSMCSMVVANKIVTTSKTGYHYRKHDGSITSNQRTSNDFYIFNIYQNIDNFIKEKFKNWQAQEYLEAINYRKIQDLKYFKHDCHLHYLDEFKQKLKEYFPNIYNDVIGAEIIVSLTSYPARIDTVNQTIESLLNQTLKADRVILWLAPEQFPNKEEDLPQQLLDLTSKGLTIDWYHDIKSYKKLIPTLKKYPDAVIITVDDDNIYQPNCLKKLYESYLRHPNEIQAHRVTKFLYDQQFYVQAGGREYYKKALYLNKVVGLGGVLYPPHCFYKDILNENLIMQLAPTNDDQWFWLQAVLNNVKIRVVNNPDIEASYIPGTQESALCKINDSGQKLFWKDFNRIMKYYPGLKEKLIKEAKKYKKRATFLPPYKQELENWWLRVSGHPLDLYNPKTFNEKIQWLKLYDSTPIKTKLADKYLVRDWVKEKIGEQYLIPLLGVYDRFDDIDFDKLPNRFVIKCNHGCGYNIIVKDKSQLDVAEVKAKLDKWMKENFAFRYGYELHYRDITPKIIIEKYITNEASGGDLFDYKFWCFNGKVEYIQFLSERNISGLKMAFYDKNWVKQNFVYSHPLDVKNMPRPDNLQEMIKLAETLSQGFSHVRVDFYRLDDGSLLFGEMTFTSASGTGRWNDKSINLKLGKMIKLPKLAYNMDTEEYYKPPRKPSNIFSVIKTPQKKIIRILGMKFTVKKRKKEKYKKVIRIFGIKITFKNHKKEMLMAIKALEAKQQRLEEQIQQLVSDVNMLK